MNKKEKLMAQLKEGILQILLTVMVSASFIIIFYFSYGTITESALVKTQMQSIVRSYTDIYQLFFGSTPATSCASLVAPDASAEDAQLEASNAALLNNAYTALGAGCAVGIVAFCVIWFTGRKSDITFSTMCGRTVLNLAAVAVVEYLFLTQIIANHISVDSSDTTLYVIDAVQTSA